MAMQQAAKQKRAAHDNDEGEVRVKMHCLCRSHACSVSHMSLTGWGCLFLLDCSSASRSAKAMLLLLQDRRGRS